MHLQAALSKAGASGDGATVQAGAAIILQRAFDPNP